MVKLTKKDKSVTISTTGRIRIKLHGVQCAEFCDLLDKVLKHVTEYTWNNRYLNLLCVEPHAGLALIQRLYTELTTLPNTGELKLTFTRTEAIILWATIKRAEAEMGFFFPAVTQIIDKLYQKLT